MPAIGVSSWICFDPPCGDLDISRSFLLPPDHPQESLRHLASRALLILVGNLESSARQGMK